VRKLTVALLAYFVVFGALAAWRWHIWTFGADSGTFTQVIANTFDGFRDGPEQGTHFRFHWAPLLAVLWPALALGRSPLVLQFAQIALIGATAIPLYALARGYVSEERAFAYAALALLYPPLGAVAFTEFHEIAFYPVLVLALVWAAERARWRAFALFACLAALVREEACIVLALAGLCFTLIAIVRRDAPRERGRGLLAGTPREPERLAVAGFGLAALNVAALFVYYRIVIPQLGSWQPSRFYDFSFARGPAQLVVSIVSHPANAATFFTLGRATYLLEALVPLAFLPLFSRWSLSALPGLLVVLLSSDPIVWRMGSHYAAIWCPWLLLGAVAALVHRPRPIRWYRSAVALCVVFLIAFNPMHVAHFVRPAYPHDDAARALALVPPDALLVTHDEWFTHVAYLQRRATFFLCPNVEYAAFALDYPNGYYQHEVRPEVAREVASGQMRVIAAFGRVRLYRRTPKAASSARCITLGDERYRSLRASLGD
jgi:uncharacterized membrane protein